MSKSTIAFVFYLSVGLVFISSTVWANDWDTTSLPRSYAYKLQLDPLGRVYAFADSVIFRSTDEGLTWTSLGIFRRYAQTMAINSTGTLYLGNTALGVFRSTDNGQQWSNSLVTEGCNGLAVNPRGDLYAGLTYTGNGKIHRSTDSGDSWAGIQLPNASNSFATECFAFGDNDEVYAGTIDGFYRSTNSGQSWTQFNSGLLGKHVRKMIVAADQSIFIHTTYSASIDGLYRSTDRGQSWQRISGSMPFFTGLASANDGNLYGTSDAGVFRSSDNGAIWVNISAELGTSPQLTSIVVTPGGRILAGGRYIFRSRTTLTSTNETASLPTEFSLMQNYPNPFNPGTTIEYALPQQCIVKLEVYNSLGQRVAFLVDETKRAGYHSERFDGGSLSSGFYFYRLSVLPLARRDLVPTDGRDGQTGGSVQTRKLLLLK